MSFPRLAANFAFRRTFWEGVSKARKRRTSSIMPSASSLFFSLLSALSIGSPFLTITSGIKNLILRMLFERGVNSSRGFSERQSIKQKSLGRVSGCSLEPGYTGRSRSCSFSCSSSRDRSRCRRRPRFRDHDHDDDDHEHEHEEEEEDHEKRGGWETSLRFQRPTRWVLRLIS